MRQNHFRPSLEPVESRLMCDTGALLAMAGCNAPNPLQMPPPGPNGLPDVPDPTDVLQPPVLPSPIPSNPANLPFLINLGHNPVDSDPMDLC